MIRFNFTWLSTTISEEEGFYDILKENWLSMVEGILFILEYIVVTIVVVYAEIYLESSIIRFFFSLSLSLSIKSVLNMLQLRSDEYVDSSERKI